MTSPRTDQQTCPDASVHGNPFRYCPTCPWTEEAPVKADPDQFLRKAKESVIQTAPELTSGDLYIVWFAKVLGNWKALLSTDHVEGVYWEVTYNGAKQETYVDTYHKRDNVALKDTV